MSFREPLLLVGLGLLPLAVLAYVAAQRRRRRFAVRYTNVDLLASVARASPLRHLPALLVLLAFAALLVALARPERTVAAKREEATVIMVTDTSGSMLAKDVRPDRLTAAREAARTLARQVPEDFRIGLIKFGSQAEQVVDPTTDRARLMLALRQLSVQGATAMGDGLKLGLEAALTPVPDGLGGTRKLPTAIVLLSDGASTRGEDPIDIAQQAKKAKIRIYTVALGTPNGTLETTQPRRLDAHGEGAAGHADAAGHRARHRRALLQRARRRPARGGLLRARDALRDGAREAGDDPVFAGGGLVLLLGGLAFSLLRGGRLP